ncbi:MAG: M14 family metallopeptidase [Pyrinomonadaceae bacterium]
MSFPADRPKGLSRYCFLLCLLVFAQFAWAQPKPESVLGFKPGEDYKLAHWSSIVSYFKKLDAASSKVTFKEIGKTTLGKPFGYALISSPANLKNLAKFVDINNKLADPRLISRSDERAKKLIAQGKTFVLITHGIHSTEVGSTLSSTEIAYRLASSKDPRIANILSNTIIIMVPSLNPDGVDIVKDWYDKTLGTKFEGTSPPELYHKYVGHDNNRDWYAFTQIETQLTVKYIHNVYHPQIVHDIHQQGPVSARYFVPPYLNPVEPNVPKEIIEGYTELGNHIAQKMRGDGKKGITTDSTYDAWTPARAYSHYHGGVRILSETASARIASPIEVKFEDLRGSLGIDAKKESANFSPVWEGGKWTIGDIVDYMTTGAFHLLDHAATHREEWLTRFFKIGFDATGKTSTGDDKVLVISQNSYSLVNVLNKAGVDTELVESFAYKNDYFILPTLVRSGQPYYSFAKALTDQTKYPNLIDEKGEPIPPYDVTAHDFGLLSGARVMEIADDGKIKFKKVTGQLVTQAIEKPEASSLRYGLLATHTPSMDEGWTRWVTENYGDFLNFNYGVNGNAVSVAPDAIADSKLKAVVFPDQGAEELVRGYSKDSMPDEYVGGFDGEKVEKLKKYVRDGGRLVFLNRSSDFAIEQLGLPVENIAKNWNRREFYIPGSILKMEIDYENPEFGMINGEHPSTPPVWFERSPVFALKNSTSDDVKATIIGTYPRSKDKLLLAGWALGGERIAGKGALVFVRYGKGLIVLFGFRPQYRGQSRVTFPMFFNAIGMDF